jgi:tripartite-type tricarboxylate transporter receptor subunit TctC
LYGTSRHLSCELFNAAAGIAATHVPYKGTGPATQALVAGEIDWLFEALGSAAGQIRAGNVRPIVVTSTKRSPAFPEIPTAIESGLSGFEVTSWYGLWVPVGTPPALVQKLHDAVVKAFADPELRDTWAKLGADPGGATPEAFRALIDKDVAKWAKVVQEAKITLE